MGTAAGRTMGKKKPGRTAAGGHDPNTLSVRLGADYRERLERVTAVTRRAMVTEICIALDEYLPRVEAKIEAGAFSSDK